MTRVLFVCLGNICRSPLAEGVFRAHVERAGLADRFEIDSAGTAGYHVGEAPDPRSVSIAHKHGVDLSAQRARKLVAADLERFDEVLAMDQSNLANIRRLAGPRSSARTGLFLDEVPGSSGAEVPDPYYGGPNGFLHVYRLVDEASERLLARLRG